MLAQIKTDIESYVRGKTWYWYLPVWIFGAYIFVSLIRFSPIHQSPFPILIAHSFNFFLHEMAHIVMGFSPAMIVAASGSFSEILLGTLLILLALRGRSYFTVLICSLWFMLACQSAGAYMADARAQQLSLVSLGGALSGSDTAIHDWNFIFGKLHLLNLDVFIGGTMRVAGALVGLAGLIFTGWLMYRMTSMPAEKSEADAAADPQKNRDMKRILSSEPGTRTDSNPKLRQPESIYPAATKGPLADAHHEPGKEDSG